MTYSVGGGKVPYNAGMPRITLILAGALIILGIAFYFIAGGVWDEDKTALIATGFGIPFVILGLLAYRPSWRAWTMHLAVALALIFCLGTLRGVWQTIQLVTGTELERPLAAIEQAAMFVLLLIYVIVAIRSFLVARRARQTESAPTA